MVNLFSVPAFFILFRETLECSIILAVLLSLLHRLIPDNPAFRKRLTYQVWIGVILGLVVSLVIGGIFIAVFYTVAFNLWQKAEPIWEGVFSLLAAIVITVMAMTMLRMERAQERWERKLHAVAQASIQTAATCTSHGPKRARFAARYALALLAFTVVVREGLETIVFLGGIGFNDAWSSLPIAAVAGVIAGLTIGYILYRTGNRVAIKSFLLATTLILLVMAAGMFTKAVHEFEEATGNEHFVWKLACCDPNITGSGWSVFNALFGWNNEATIGTLCAWFLYWVFAVLVYFGIRTWEERKEQKRIIKERNETTLIEKETPVVIAV